MRSAAIEEAPRHGTLHAWLALNCVGLGNLPRARAPIAEAREYAAPWVERKLAEGFLFRDKGALRSSGLLSSHRCRPGGLSL